MWKKTEEPTHSTPSPAPQPTVSPRPEPRSEIATLGSSISIVGDLTGDEDLLIQGRIEGEISLKKNKVIVGKNGRVKADIYGKSIHVDGDVVGNLFGDDEIIIRQTGHVQGNLTAPRVTLENGSKFKGSIDMEPRRAEGGKQKSKPQPQQKAAAAATQAG